MKRVLYVLLILVIASLACSSGSGGGDGNILYQDDFSNENSGWPVSADSDKAASYTDGQYLIQAFAAKQDVWAHPHDPAEKSFSDVSIEVDATKFSGTDNNDFGIVCRFVDDNNFYFLIISSDGYQVIGKYENGEIVYLSSDEMQPTDAVKQGSATNHLRADCVGSTLTLYVNGQQVASVTDTSFTSGDIGLTVGTFDEPNASVTFDNFVVFKPQ